MPWFGALLLHIMLSPVAAHADSQLRSAAGTIQWAEVDYVIDGDTVILSDRRRVRLIGIESPETGKGRAPEQPLARAARGYLHRLVASKTVRLVLGRETHDRYGRVLAHLWADGSSVQESLLRQGLAVVVAIPPNLIRLDSYQSAERLARADERGIWGHPHYRAITADRLRREHTGFRFVTGRIHNVHYHRNYVHLQLSSRLTLRVPREDWAYFTVAPEELQGTPITVRGWVTRYKDGLQIRVRHPAMLRRHQTNLNGH